METRAPPSFLARSIPCFLAFIASFCIMVVELVAGRLIAKHIGASLYTWTSVIGVILGGITLGNFIGGYLADRFNTRKTLCVLFWLAAIVCLCIPFWDNQVGAENILKLKSIKDNWPLRIALHVTAVFLVPATMLGLIGPVVAKMALDQGLATGSTVGRVYAWGAFGSIVGTFLTGFYLIQLLGTAGIIIGVAGVLGLVGLCLAPLLALPFLGLFGLFSGWQVAYGNWEVVRDDGRLFVRGGLESDQLYMDETQYSYIEVTQDEEEQARDLTLDNLIHAHYVPGDIKDLRYDYEDIYAAVTTREAGEKQGLNAFFVGGGGYIFPRYVLARWPSSRVEVAEIDPGVTRAVMAAFDLKPSEARILKPGEPPPRAPDPATGQWPIEIHHLDARIHVEDLLARKAQGRFDFIYGDAFNDYAVPFHLITREFTAKVRELLKPETGIYLINIIDIYHSSRFVGAVYNTLAAVFPEVYVFCTTEDGPDMDETGRDTFIVIGALRPLDLEDLGSRGEEPSFEGSQLTGEHLETLKERSGGVVLTDDFSPVENFLEYVVKNRSL